MEKQKDINSLNTFKEESECTACQSHQNLSKFDKYAYTGILCFANLTYGISLTIFSPALIDFRDLLSVSTEIITQYFTLFAIGTILGSLFGFLFKYINRQLSLIIILTLFGLANGFSPQCPNFILLYLCGFICGFGAGTLDTAQTVWLIEIWGKASGPVLQFSEFCYGLGIFTGPFIIQPYITANSDFVDLDATTVDTITTTHNINETIDKIDYRRNLTIPFTISGSFQLIGAIALLFMYFYHKYIPLDKPEVKMGEEFHSIEIISLAKTPLEKHFTIGENKKSISKSNKKLPRKTILGIGAVGFAFIGAAEMAYVDYSPTYFLYTANISGSESAYLLSSATAAYTLTRVFCIYIAMKLKPSYMLTYHYFIIFCACILLYFAHLSQIIVWLGNITFGIGLATFWPSTFSHIESLFEVNDNIGTIYVTSFGVISIVTQFIEGPLMDKYPKVMLYYCSFCIAISYICFALIRLIVWKSEYKSNLNESNDKNNNVMKI